LKRAGYQQHGNERGGDGQLLDGHAGKNPLLFTGLAAQLKLTT
jgi:hypothetical protein